MKTPETCPMTSFHCTMRTFTEVLEKETAMKWLRRVFIAVVILAFVPLGAAFVTALRTEHPVGFRVLRATPADGEPMTIGVWYPTRSRPRPRGSDPDERGA